MCGTRQLGSIGITAAIVLLAGASAGRADPVASSTFDAGDEGWKVVSTLGYYGSPSWAATGGNPGGFIYAVDPDTGAFGFAAPAKFLGDVSAAYGTPLSFDIAAYDTPDAATGWVGLEGGGHTLIWHFPAPSTIYPDWHSRSVNMTETGGWEHLDSGLPPTHAEMVELLDDLDGMVITAEFIEGLPNDISGLDNVILAPEPTALAALAAASVALIARRRRR